MIICCGEALIDMVPRQIPGEGSGFLPVPGGAAFNTAIALGRLGEKTGLFSGLSTDLFGDRLDDALTEAGVTSGFSVRSGRPTTLAFVEFAGGNARYTFYDENSAGRLLSVTDLPVLPHGTQALVFGAISLIPEPCGTAYETLLSREATRRVVYLDPNIRPGFIQDATAHRDRIARMIGQSDIVKVSDEDMQWLAPGMTVEEVAGGWLKEGVAIVVLTRGANGALAITTNDRVEISGTPANVVDTVGAGDTFSAGFLADLRRAGCLTKQALRTLDAGKLTNALTFGARVAAITVARAGANPPWAGELGLDPPPEMAKTH